MAEQDNTKQPADEKPTGIVTGPETEAKSFTQADVDRIVADRLSREKVKAQELADKARHEAETAAALKNGEFEKLATDYKSQLDALTPKAEYAERLVETLTAQLDARVKRLPADVAVLDPGGDVLARLTWLDKAEALAAKLTGAAQGTQGNKPAPKPAGQPTEQEAAQRELELKRRFRLS